MEIISPHISFGSEKNTNCSKFDRRLRCYEKNPLAVLSILLSLGLVIFFLSSGSPQRKPLPVQKLLYRDNDYSLYVQDNQVVVKGSDGESSGVLQVSESRFTGASRIKNKPKDKIPLLGISLADSIFLQGDKYVYVINLRPEPRIIMTYPNPKTRKHKIIVQKDQNVLYFYQQGTLVKKYPIATGKKDFYTPEGTFKIVNKTPYPQGKEPDTLLGPRWMGLSVPYQKDKRAENDSRAPRGMKYGIHGTNEPASIGKHASGGCIRLNNKDIAELYDRVSLGTEVEIR
ncbi:hypothetical protein P378_03110 [Desulforamulus profundi]|uniref:L,D-TPase catalytic domain-containing protein n=1 Tax=Desulforamulus profundi TaxID=1383067 RepID=A0A2C6LLD9_9FIRM|nr:hypothetical protein P378_03110 [Desulforamulus profundi]